MNEFGMVIAQLKTVVLVGSLPANPIERIRDADFSTVQDEIRSNLSMFTINGLPH